ncbi:hypothetical protein C5C99_16205 [Rathayibacter sp. AY1C4]|uniref:hypothetical protein n=1 Tax=Rathayibacter sp. AY1C4 TaxID=2080537 RepID=UPI000CE8417C|nr:hypothetical protein [Rathayibacter sp. AY1C4]PPH16318.1 hypothetical protein C5C99_16205 [Rathayibacter sp. AY1C4]
MMSKTLLRTTLIGGALLLVLSGCAGTATSGSTLRPFTPTLPSSSAAPSATATATAPTADTAQKTGEQVAAVLTGVQFVPGEYASIQEMLDSIYPGLTATDASCLSPFGLGWDTAQPAAGLSYGTSADRSMTAVVSSTGTADAAASLLASATDATTRCASGSTLFAMQGVPVETTVERTEQTLTGADETLGWKVSGAVGGKPFSLVGITARVGGDAVALVGWDPTTNTSYVPRATQLVVDGL